jgi:hypothetical protein
MASMKDFTIKLHVTTPRSYGFRLWLAGRIFAIGAFMLRTKVKVHAEPGKIQVIDNPGIRYLDERADMSPEHWEYLASKANVAESARENMHLPPEYLAALEKLTRETKPEFEATYRGTKVDPPTLVHSYHGRPNADEVRCHICDGPILTCGTADPQGRPVHIRCFHEIAKFANGSSVEFGTLAGSWDMQGASAPDESPPTRPAKGE